MQKSPHFQNRSFQKLVCVERRHLTYINFSGRPHLETYFYCILDNWKTCDNFVRLLPDLQFVAINILAATQRQLAFSVC